MKILFFSPHSAIWVHAFPEALVAESLQRKRHEIMYITCGEQFRAYCVAMSAFGLMHESSFEKKSNICNKCKAHRDIIRFNLKLNGYDLAEKITSSDVEYIDDLLRRVTRENFLELKIDNVAIGRFALYHFLLRHKKINLEFSDEEWNRYLTELKNSLFAFFGCRKIIDQERPDRVVVYNSLYPVNRVCCEIAKQRGIPAYFLHAGGNLSNRLQTLMFGRDHTLRFLENCMSHWEHYKSRPCLPPLSSYITDHFLELFKGRSPFAYSTGKSVNGSDIRKRFGIGKEQKLLVATMGSYDEEFAAEITGAIPDNLKLLFPLQTDWIQALVKFVEQRKDLFLLIRVHPREFPNKRDKLKSEHARLLDELFSHLPDNVKVNWPSDQLSIYDVAEEADVFLNSWSNAGKEMTLLGIPVVIYSPALIYYPADLNYVGTTLLDYYNKIDQALKDGWSIENTRKAYRWLAVEYGHSIIDISESYKEKEATHRRFFTKLMHVFRSRINPYYKLEKDCHDRAPRLKAEKAINAIVEGAHYSILDIATIEAEHGNVEEETLALKIEVKRIIHALYGSKPNLNGAANSLCQKLTTFSSQ